MHARFRCIVQLIYIYMALKNSTASFRIYPVKMGTPPARAPHANRLKSGPDVSTMSAPDLRTKLF